MNSKKYIVIVLFSVLAFTVIGQKKKADMFYDQYNYRGAISLYPKVIESSSTDTSSIIKLANAYYIVKDYDNAEKYYALAAAMNGVPAKVIYNYAQVLKNNGKIDEALVQFNRYVALAPKDTSGSSEVKYCNRLKGNYANNYQVGTVTGLNSEYAEFSPAFYNDSLVFVSDRNPDMVNFSKNKYTGGNYLKVFYAAPVMGGFANPKPAPVQINGDNADYNIGPVSYSADGSKVFFTEVASIHKSHFVNRMKVYYYEKTGSSWGDRKAFEYNSDDYSVMHPGVSPDGNRLFFVSDMPGGFGGMDIYVCDKTATGWSKPKNLGAEVNTPGNEVFPYMRNDGVLFFSSDKHFNFGGLDIFSCNEVNGSWTKVQNLGADINSSTDDFGICFNKNNRSGYFSSNRKGGKGKDDIYSFVFTGDYLPLKGKVLFSFAASDIVAGVAVSVIDDSGHVVAVTRTDSAGRFIFDKLRPEANYIVKVDENDSRFAGKQRLYLTDKNGRIVAATKARFNNGKYCFVKLPPDLTTMPPMNEEPTNLAGNILHGDSSKPLANVVITLVSDKDSALQSVTTNAFGSFVFDDIASQKEYTFKVYTGTQKLPSNTKIVLTDKSGNVIREIFLTGDGEYYKFKILASDTVALKKLEVDDTKLRLQLRDMLLSEDKKPMTNLKVNLLDRNRKLFKTANTDSAGIFVFNNLPAGEDYMIEFDTTDARLTAMRKMYLADTHHNIIRELLLGRNYRFRILPADENTLGSIYADDPWLAALNIKKGKQGNDMQIIENIYFDYGKNDILPAAANLLNKLVLVMQANPDINVELDAYTDPRGADQFNMELSQKRADAAVAYVIKQGVNKKRVSGKGYGKTHPLNNCGDPKIHCTEEQYAINRRLEFKISQGKK